MARRESFYDRAKWNPSSDAINAGQTYRLGQLTQRREQATLADMADKQRREEVMRKAYQYATDGRGQTSEPALYDYLSRENQRDLIPGIREKYDAGRAGAEEQQYKRTRDASADALKASKESREVSKSGMEAEDSRLKMNNEKMKAVSARFSTLVDKPDFSSEDVVRSTKQLYDEGVIDEAMARGLIDGMPDNKEDGHRYVKGIARQSLPEDKRWEAMNPKSTEPTEYQRMQDATTRRGQDMSRATAGDKIRDKASQPPKPVKLSANAEKSIEKTRDIAQSARQMKQLVARARGLNKDAYSGWFPESRAKLVASMTGESKNANATIAMKNLLDDKAMTELKDKFPGATTNVELDLNMMNQGFSAPNDEAREAILKRLEDQLDARIKFSDSKLAAHFKGTFYTEGLDPAEEPPGGAGKAPAGDKEARINELLKMLGTAK